MLKAERQKEILLNLEKDELIKVADLSNDLGVTEMTIRRDLEDLEKLGLLQRIHGGAKTTDFFPSKEFSHDLKKTQNIEEKKQIALTVSRLISNGDIVFMGTGSTIELVHQYISEKNFKLVTNSLELFNKIKNFDNLDSMLIGGNYRKNTGAFIGKFTIDILKNLRFKLAFAGTNGVRGNDIFTYNEEEGEVQKIALNNSIKKYILADSSKMNKQDYLSYYKTSNLTAIITDDKISNKDEKIVKKYTNIIK